MDVHVTPRLATVLDQGIVAITGFSSMLLFAQTLPALDWAILSFAAGIALVSQGIQVNAVTIPMITFCRGQPIAYAEQQDWTWLNRAVLAAMLALSLVAGLVVLRIGPDWIGQSFLCAALLLPPAFSYEYLRRRLILLGDFRTLLYVSIA